jgi:hypothetical protein
MGGERWGLAFAVILTHTCTPHALDADTGWYSMDELKFAIGELLTAAYRETGEAKLGPEPQFLDWRPTPR